MIGIGTHIRSARQRDLYQIPVTGQASGTNGTIVFVATQDLVVTANGPAAIVSEAKANEGSNRRHTIVFSCTASQSGNIVIRGASKIIKLGSEVTTAADFYTGTNATAPILTWDLNKLPVNLIVIRQNAAYANILPTLGTKALPTGLTLLYLNGANINWTYSGAVPTTLTTLFIVASNVTWTYDGALPTGLTLLYLNGAKIDWTGLNIGNTGTMTVFQLLNYRITKMSSVDMVTLLTQMKDSAKVFPSSLVINDYADFASPPTAVTDAVAALIAVKTTITSVTLGA